MAGGFWETQNKVRPGAYVNFETNALVATGLDSRGAEVVPIKADWGETGKFIKVSPNTKFKEKFGKSLDELIPIREAFKGTGEVIVYNLNGKGEKAKATNGTFTVTAIHGGSDGNKIVVMVAPELEGGATVKTFFDGNPVDSQEVISSVELKPNAYVAFSGELPTSETTLTLKDGTTVAATNESYSDLAAGLDSQRFKTIAIGTDDDSIKLLFSLKIKQWREQEGKNVTFVTNDYKAADHEGVVSVLNGVMLDGGEELAAKESVYWYGAAYANATTNSLTYAEYPGAIDCERLSHDEIVKALQDGHIVYTYNEGADGVDKVVVEQDINTFRSFTPIKNQDFRKNKIVRQMDIVSNNVQHIYSRFFIGKVDNDENGRNLFKGQIMTVILDPLVRRGAIEPYDPDDIHLQQGAEKDAVLASMGLKFNDAMEKLYMTVECK
ncbi:phage tail sheath C-terminal domain-containing protein [Heyndrickxia oleronia]|uniref:Phage tail protein n=1 Tax=Heyndrickxia oleronia TaxID=38875 RepID=A0A8E2IDS4_9BACI|nr:phage tail sheath C-terminal domain-containing protein [Heyndrickxia oleronia]MEC1373415.1 phage tail sheath C-terminal domain-containing protein [Heyndrickxia oleronia]OOP69538.1 phage tail protein [Heyndrickxia oleronia]QQZ04291.1 phage tail sheath subtilisin-like domain-containing protein [Heyndrickxia oleronia]